MVENKKPLYLIEGRLLTWLVGSTIIYGIMYLTVGHRPLESWMLSYVSYILASLSFCYIEKKLNVGPFLLRIVYFLIMLVLMNIIIQSICKLL